MFHCKPDLFHGIGDWFSGTGSLQDGGREESVGEIHPACGIKLPGLSYGMPLVGGLREQLLKRSSGRSRHQPGTERCLGTSRPLAAGKQLVVDCPGVPPVGDRATHLIDGKRIPGWVRQWGDRSGVEVLELQVGQVNDEDFLTGVRATGDYT